MRLIVIGGLGLFLGNPVLVYEPYCDNAPPLEISRYRFTAVFGGVLTKREWLWQVSRRDAYPN